MIIKTRFDQNTGAVRQVASLVTATNLLGAARVSAVGEDELFATWDLPDEPGTWDSVYAVMRTGCKLLIEASPPLPTPTVPTIHRLAAPRRVLDLSLHDWMLLHVPAGATGDNGLTLDDAAEIHKIGYNSSSAGCLYRMKRQGLVSGTSGSFVLTDKGRARRNDLERSWGLPAEKMIEKARAHESYLRAVAATSEGRSWSTTGSVPA